jgi:hypothetical protein
VQLALVGAVVAAASLLLTPGARAVNFPQPGVICDSPTQICFDQQGPSLPLTRQFFGQVAANRLLAQLTGRPPQREFMLSGGQLCDLNQRTCWDDGWRRRAVSVPLSRQLFGAGPMPGPMPVPGPQVSQGNRSCQLNQRGMPMFNGACRLYRQNDGYSQSYVVEMGSGQVFRYQRRGNLLVLNDATGTWPVFLFDRGNSVQFRWANLLLDVTRPMQARGGPAGGTAVPSAAPRSTGEASPDLIDGLFQ